MTKRKRCNLDDNKPQNNLEPEQWQTIKSYSSKYAQMPPVKFVQANAAKDIPKRHHPRTDIADFYNTIAIQNQSRIKDKIKDETSKENLSFGKSPVLIACPSCNALYDVASKQSHLASITHQHALIRQSPPPDPLYLNETNRGYQLLLSQGWDDDAAIGAHPGRRHPIATRFKIDHHGLGFDKTSRSRVTHDLTEIMNAEVIKRIKDRQNQIKASAKEARKTHQREKIARERLLAYMKR